MNTRKRLGAVGVDSGQLLIIDPCYLGDGDWANLKTGGARASASYMAVMRTTLGYDPETDIMVPADALQAGEVHEGVAFNTQIGDGRYPVYGVYDAQDNLLRVVIRIQ